MSPVSSVSFDSFALKTSALCLKPCRHRMRSFVLDAADFLLPFDFLVLHNSHSSCSWDAYTHCRSSLACFASIVKECMMQQNPSTPRRERVKY